jgi:hypothetical protein
MFNKKDYLDYFGQLYDVEIIMKKEVEELLKIIEDPIAREILDRIRKDEIRHAKIIKSMIKLI